MSDTLTTTRQPPTRLSKTLEAEHSRLFLWSPVCFGTGIALYFSLLSEPSVATILAFLAASAVMTIAASYNRTRAPLALVMSYALLWCALGVTAAKFRTVTVASPSISKPTKVVRLTGWVERTEKNKRGQRLLIRIHSLALFAQRDKPYRVRLQNNIKNSTLAPGDFIQASAVLRPLPEPVQPSGFDFAKKAWFQKIGAIGYVIAAPKVQNAPTDPPWGIALRAQVEITRNNISQKIRMALPGYLGAIADALITGNRAAIPEDQLEALRASGLAHILAISGLHMGLMVGTIFWAVRALLALWPPIALNYPIKKIASLSALCAGLGYLILSGASISTIRAYIMVAVMLFAILVGRQAISLRNAALAALLILVLWPEFLLDVGFQMSFAAVTALVAHHEWRVANNHPTGLDRNSKEVPKLLQILSLPRQIFRYVIAVATTTLVASLAVAPFAAFHFNKVAQFSLVANIFAMPIVALIVMPAALISMIMMPFGLEFYPLWIMGQGIDAVLDIAGQIKALQGSVRYVPIFSPWALAIITLGGLWLLLWKTKLRLIGVAIILCGMAIAPMRQPPDILIERDAKTFAIRNASGLLVAPKKQGGRYSLTQWLRADGDTRSVDQMKHGQGYRCDELGCVAKVKGKQISFILHPAALEEDCTRGDVIIVTWPLFRACNDEALIIDRRALKSKGAHAIYIIGDKFNVETASGYRGQRPWTTQ